MDLEEQHGHDHVAHAEEDCQLAWPAPLGHHALSKDHDEVARVAAVVEVRGQAVRHHQRGDAREVPVAPGRHFEGEGGLDDCAHAVEAEDAAEKPRVFRSQYPGSPATTKALQRTRKQRRS